MVFMGYVDDATGQVFGRFYDHEGVFPAMRQSREGIYTSMGFLRVSTWINTALIRRPGT